MIKKLFSLIMVCVLLFSMFYGCDKGSGPKEPLHILWDGIQTQWHDKLGREFKNLIVELGGPEDIEIEFLNNDDTEDAIAERTSRVTRLKVEMMAGKGPDLFIISRTGDNSLFLTPEKSMGLNLLKNLDEYMENTQFMDMDKLTSVVMDAGVTEEGRYILPIAYSLPVTCFLKEDLPEAPAGDTWQDILEDETGFLQVSGARHEVIEIGGYPSGGNTYITNTFGTIADYGDKKLNFTEEELLQRIEEMLAIEEKAVSNEWGLPNYFTTRIGTWFGFYNNKKNFIKNVIPTAGEKIGQKKDLTMIPVYNDDGGVTVTITDWAAINANAKRPDDAFFVLDAMLSQQGFERLSQFYSNFVVTLSAPVYEDVFSPEFAASCAEQYGKTEETDSITGWCFNENNFAEYRRIREQITVAQFSGEITGEIGYLYLNCANDPEKMEELVHQAYMRMKQELSE